MEWERERNRIKESLTDDQRNEGDTEGVCRHLRIPLQWEPVWAHISVCDTIHLLATLSTPPIGGAHALTGICVTNLFLSLPRLHTLTLFITWLFLHLSLSFLPLSPSLMYGQKRLWGGLGGSGAVAIGNLDTNTVMTWRGLSVYWNKWRHWKIEKEGEKSVVLMTNTKEELEPETLVLFEENYPAILLGSYLQLFFF